MDTQTTVPVTLTEAEAEVLTRARMVLKALQERTWQAGWIGEGEHRPASLGRVAGDAERAENAIFELLNSSSSYLDDEAAKTAITSWIEEPRYAAPEAS